MSELLSRLRRVRREKVEEKVKKAAEIVQASPRGLDAATTAKVKEVTGEPIDRIAPPVPTERDLSGLRSRPIDLKPRQRAVTGPLGEEAVFDDPS